MSKMPLILYKYVGVKDGLDLIKNSRIKVQNIAKFNDPFEMWENIPANASAQYRKYVESMREQSGEYFLASCFCSPEIDCQHDVVMWAHYAQKHAGFRIHIQLDKLPSGARLKEITYCNERMKDFIPEQISNGLNQIEIIQQNFERLRQLPFIKSNAWAYEHEWRLLIPTQNCSSPGEHGHCYYPIKAEGIIRIDYGCQCSKENVVAMQNTIKNKLTHNVICKKAFPDNHEFKMNYGDNL